MTNTPALWFKQIADHLRDYDAIPLQGNAPSFDWARFSALVASHFGVQNFSIRADAQKWRESSDLEKGLGKDIAVFPLKVLPLEGSIFWMMSQQEINKFATWMLQGQNKSRPIASSILTEGFFRFLLLQLLDCASEVQPFHKLSFQLSEESPIPQTDAFCIDIEIEFEGKSCWGRLAIEPELQKSWVAHFEHWDDRSIPESLAQNLEIDLGVQIGSCDLTQQEWKKCRLGDVLILERSSYDPRKHDALAVLALGSLPLFEAKIKHNKLELLGPCAVREKQRGNPMPQPHESDPVDPLLESSEATTAIKDLPLLVTVELARFRMNLGKLLKMTPGNLIELPIHPEQTVHLTVDGRLIAKGELVHLGETVGVRIIESV